MSELSYYVTESNPDWLLVAAIDESENYEVDVTEIWRSPDGPYHLLTASGCSCWDGDYETRSFDTLDDLEKAARSGLSDEYTYNPSAKGLEELMSVARSAK